MIIIVAVAGIVTAEIIVGGIAEDAIIDTGTALAAVLVKDF